MTSYEEVQPTDRAVAQFIAARAPQIFNVYHPPIQYWVARRDGEIVALLALSVEPYLSLDLVRADPRSRPFMVILKLWKLAEAWLRARNVPAIAVTILDTSLHFQDLVKRMGFEPCGVETNTAGEPVETIFIKQLGGSNHGDSPRAAG